MNIQHHFLSHSYHKYNHVYHREQNLYFLIVVAFCFHISYKSKSMNTAFVITSFQEADFYC